MRHKTAENRLNDIYSSFDTLISANKGLSAVAPTTEDTVAKCTVLLLADGDDRDCAQVQLDISVLGAQLVARSGQVSASVGTAKIVDELTVDLSEGFNWDDGTFESSDEMAFFLLKHMRRRLLAVGDLHSDGSS